MLSGRRSDDIVNGGGGGGGGGGGDGGRGATGSSDDSSDAESDDDVCLWSLAMNDSTAMDIDKREREREQRKRKRKRDMERERKGRHEHGRGARGSAAECAETEFGCGKCRWAKSGCLDCSPEKAEAAKRRKALRLSLGGTSSSNSGRRMSSSKSGGGGGGCSSNSGGSGSGSGSVSSKISGRDSASHSSKNGRTAPHTTTTTTTTTASAGMDHGGNGGRAHDHDIRSVKEQLSYIAQHLRRHWPLEEGPFLTAARARVTPNIFVEARVGSTSDMVWTSDGGIDSSCFTSAVGFKLESDSRFRLGDRLDGLAETCKAGVLDGVGAMRALRDEPQNPISWVTVKCPSARDRASPDDSADKKTIEFSTFIDGGRGAVHRCPSSEQMLVFDRQFSTSNWVTNIHNHEINGGAPSLQFMHAPFVTEAHFDNMCVAPCLKQIAGESLFLAWSFEEGRACGLTDEADATTWTAGDGWRKFFMMSSSRLILLRPADVAVIAPGAYHRVFTLKTKVVGYAHFLDSAAMAHGLPSMAYELQHTEDWIGPRGSLTYPPLILLEGLRYEAIRSPRSHAAALMRHLVGTHMNRSLSKKDAGEHVARLVTACESGDEDVYELLAQAGNELRVNLLDLLRKVSELGGAG